MCQSMVEIYSAALGEEKKERKKETGQNIMSASAMQGGHNYKQHFFITRKKILQPHLFNVTKSFRIKQCEASVGFIRMRYAPNPDSFRHSLNSTAKLKSFTTYVLQQCITNISFFLTTLCMNDVKYQ